ncbi:MAG TPA: hypothetical protein PLD14_03435 [Candidatus Pacearchaeota archaeon]|nr:hypothetical protein [Candidatus Pacearchaeota archaeon]HPR80248.1 hypothetical protein [Candidatus Pacearchaeota archaeon]
MKKNPDINLRETQGGAVAYLYSKEGIKYDIPLILCGQELRMNISEGKRNDRLVTVVCSTRGEPKKPFWVKSQKNQRDVDKEVDARFSLRGPACVITVNNQGRFSIYDVWIEIRHGHAEVRTEEVFSVFLKRNKGKFIFSESMFGSDCFKEAAIAAIKKANISDGGGPMFFLEKDPAVIFREEGSPMAFTQDKKGAVFSAGMTMRSSSQT